MKVEVKQEVVKEIAGKLDAARAFYLTDFTGLDVKSMTELRAKLRAEGIEYLVVKNSMAQRAVEALEVPDIAEFFIGPTGLVIGTQDAVTPAKVIWEFAKEHDDKPTVKVGIVEGEKVDATGVGKLAKLPPREQLLAELAGAMQAPMAELAALMQAMLYEVAGLIDALRVQRDAAGS
ncbi:MAG: 50S ribosomal protein L10 [Gemmatimonadota bacterium]